MPAGAQDGDAAGADTSVPDRDDSEPLRAAVEAAHANRTPVVIHGRGSKAFLVPPTEATSLTTLGHTGIVDYRPDELVATARAGTPLVDLARTIEVQDQALPFDPPRFGGDGTLGGAVAAGLSGPGRPWLGSVRDAVLGVEIVNGLGERLRFGGQVLKNVAGYDVSRLMTGAFGTLGVLLQASVRVQPAPESVAVLAKTCSADDASQIARDLLRAPLPVTATCHVDGVLRIRLAGSADGVRHAREVLGLDLEAEHDRFFAAVRDHAHPFFAGAHSDGPMWCLSLPRGAAFNEPDTLVEWAGARVWWRTDADARTVHARARAHQGFAASFGGPEAAPTPAPIAKYMRRLKAAFDPAGILNPGAMTDAH